MKMKRSSRIILMLLILLFPSFLYIVFTTGKHHIESMEILGPKENDLPYQAPEFTFQNFYGGQLNTADLSDDILVYNFFCATCSDSSSRSLLLVKAITERFFDKKDIKYLSINLTPSKWDSAEIGAYIKPFNPDPEHWFFLNGDSLELKRFLENGLLLNSVYDSIQKPYYPGMSTIIVVDKNRHIRAFLDGGQYVDQSSLISVIRGIRLEEYQKNATRREEQFQRKR